MSVSDERATGRARGGVAAAESMTAEERKDRARKGATARWHGEIRKATHGSSDHPLKIGEIEIPCYVLDDETRVLSQRGVVGSLGMKQGSRGGAGQLSGFLAGKTLSPFVSKELLLLSENPIKFRHPGGGGIAFGYPATILADICDAVLAARKAGVLQKQQEHIAEHCEILVRGFARVGIIALVDEATGYQQDRAKDALARILEAFIDKELQPWIQTFPGEFYQEMFRLRGLKYPNDTVRRPQYFGVLTNDVVYKRLAPGVLTELRRVTPKTESGRRKYHFFQRLTTNVGYPKLKEHLGAVVAFMQTSESWHEFISKLDRFRPRYNETYPLALGYEESSDDGKGL